MTSSFDTTVERGLDAMLIVYSLVDGHPASTICEEFIRKRSGWFTTALTILEVQTVLTKIYGVEPQVAAQKLQQFIAGPCVVTPVDLTTVDEAIQLATRAGIDLTDAVLLWQAKINAAFELATDDHKLAAACALFNLTALNPIDNSLRQQIATWEVSHLAHKGLPRILQRIHHWLAQHYPQAAQDFWSQTGAGSHLP